MRIALFLCVVFVGQVFGHKGMLREKVALHQAHEHRVAYTLKSGCFFVSPALEALNDHYRCHSRPIARSAQAFPESVRDEHQSEGALERRHSNHERLNNDHVLWPNGGVTGEFGDQDRSLHRQSEILNYGGTSVLGSNASPAPASYTIWPQSPLRTSPREGPISTSTPVVSRCSGNINTDLNGWNLVSIPSNFGYDSERALREAIKKVYAERREFQRSNGQDSLVNLSQLLQDPYIRLWTDLPRLGEDAYSLDSAFDQIKSNRPNDSHGALDSFREKLENSPLYESNPDFFAREIFDLVNAALNRQQDQLVEATRQNEEARVQTIIEDGPFGEIVALMISHADSCADAVVSAFETICSIGVSMKLEDAINRGTMTQEDSEKAFLSFCLSLLKQHWIRGYAADLGGGEIIERQIQANKLVNQVFPMGTIVDRALYNFGFEPMTPRGLAEHLCQSNVDLVVASVADAPAWKRYVKKTPEYQALKVETEQDDFNDNWDDWQNNVDALMRDRTRITLQIHGYLIQDRNYPLPTIA